MKLVKIKFIKKVNTPSKKYDVQTSRTNNFFANRILVHNSIMTLYHYDNQWQVSSSGTPDASGNVNGSSVSFAKLFWQVFQELGHQVPSDTNNCYMFELITQYNRVVTRCDKNKLILHGARDLKTLKELDPQAIAAANGWECVGTHDLSNWEGILEAAKNLNPMESEGYIVCDAEFNRVKVKSPQYVALAHLKDGFGIRRIVEIVRTNEGSEFLTYFPEWTDIYAAISQMYQNLIMEIEEHYLWLQPIELQKDFALKAKETRFSGILFGLRSGKVASAKEALAQMPIRNLETVLDVEE